MCGFMAMGRIDQKIEIKKSTNGNSYSRFPFKMMTTYTNNKGEKETPYVTLLAWGTTAEEIAKNVSSDDLLFIKGHLGSNPFKKDDGSINYYNDLVVEKFSIMKEGM